MSVNKKGKVIITDIQNKEKEMGKGRKLLIHHIKGRRVGTSHVINNSGLFT